MDRHVRTLGVLTIATGIAGLIIALAILYIGGGRDGLLSISYEEKINDNVSLTAIPLTGLLLFGSSIYLILMAAPMIVAGFGLIKFQVWARWMGIALHGINMLNIPVGTFLGMYSLWVLLSEETEPLFEDKRSYRD